MPSFKFRRRRKGNQSTFRSSGVKKIYKKLDRSILSNGRTKINELVRSLEENPKLTETNFFQIIEKEGREKFPDLKKGELDVLKFYTYNKFIENLEDKLQTVGDDAQLANMDLQNALQKQQQTIQLISNVSKMLHDTTMAAIRKIG